MHDVNDTFIDKRKVDLTEENVYPGLQSLSLGIMTPLPLFIVYVLFCITEN